jgi:hypothetical protein
LRLSTDPQIRQWADLPEPEIDPTYRRAAVGDVRVRRRRTTRWRGARAVTAALLLAACTGAAAIAWQSDGGTVELMIARWVPQRVVDSVLRLGKPAPAVQSTAPTVDATAANPGPPQSGSLAQTPPEGAAPTALASSVESTSSLGSNDIARRENEELKASIEELKASIEEVKASQRQMSLDIAKASEARSPEIEAAEQNLRPKTSAHPLAAAPRARKPMRPLPPPQAAASASPSVPQPPTPLH